MEHQSREAHLHTEASVGMGHESEGPLSFTDLIALTDATDSSFLLTLGIYLDFNTKDFDAIAKKFRSRRLAMYHLLVEWRDRRPKEENSRLLLAQKLQMAGLHAQADILAGSGRISYESQEGQTRSWRTPRSEQSDHIDDIVRLITKEPMSAMMKTLVDQLQTMPPLDKLRTKRNILMLLNGIIIDYKEESNSFGSIETKVRYQLQDVGESLMLLTPYIPKERTSDIVFANYVQIILGKVTNEIRQDELAWEILAMTGENSDDQLTPLSSCKDKQDGEVHPGKYVKKEVCSTDMLARYVKMQWEFIQYHRLLAFEYNACQSTKHRIIMMTEAAKMLDLNPGTHISYTISRVNNTDGKQEMSDDALATVWCQRCASQRKTMILIYESLYSASKNLEGAHRLSGPLSEESASRQGFTESDFLSRGVDFIARQKREIGTLKQRISTMDDHLKDRQRACEKRDETIESLEKQKCDMQIYNQHLQEDLDSQSKLLRVRDQGNSNQRKEIRMQKARITQLEETIDQLKAGRRRSVTTLGSVRSTKSS